MADTNGNGIPDSQERFKAGQTTRGPFGTTTRAQETGDYGGGLFPFLAEMVNSPARQGLNFLGEVNENILGIDRTYEDRIGTGLGDSVFGLKHGYYDNINRSAKPQTSSESLLGMAGGGATNASQQSMSAPDYLMAPGFLEYLSEAQGALGQLGIGQAADYSPLATDAQNSRDKNDAYLQAIYNQVRSELADDSVTHGQITDDSIDRSQQIGANAQQAMGGAYDAAQSRQDEAAKLLGLEAAQASQDMERTNVADRRADAIGDSAARGENAQLMYNTLGGNAQRLNTNMSSASNFAEADARSALNDSLASRLAEIAAMQSEANASAQSQQSNALLSLMSTLDSRGQSEAQALNDRAYSIWEQELAQQNAGQTQAPTLPSFTDLMTLMEQHDMSLEDALTLSQIQKNQGSAFGSLTG